VRRTAGLQADPAHDTQVGRHRTAAEPAAEAEPGNQAMKALFAGGPRARLEIGGVDDPEEREADRLADQAMVGPVTSPCACGGQGCPACGGAPKIRRKAESGAAPPAAVAAGFGNRAGRPLDAGTRSHFEPRFGADFSAVRVHDDRGAHRFARGIGARAFAIGRDIGFAEGRHSPGTAAGRALLAHELAHVALGHGGARRQLDGHGQITIEPLPVSRPLLGLSVKPLALDEPKTGSPFGPSGPFFQYDGVTVADDRAFMRDELRRLIADRGLFGAWLWAGHLVADDGRDSEPMIATVISFFQDVPQVPSREETRRKEEQEEAHAALAAKAIPTAQSVFVEVLEEAVDFLKYFERTGIAATGAILTESEARANAERLRFGLKRTERTLARTVYIEHGMSYTEHETVVSHSMENQLPGQGLAGAAKDLLAKQAELQQVLAKRSYLFQGGGGEAWDVEYSPSQIVAEHKRLSDLADEKQAELTLLQGIYQERYPILAGLSGDDDKLTQIAKGPSAQTAEVLGQLVFGTLDNIAQIRAELHPGGEVQIWKLPDIVALAKASSGCNEPTWLGKMKTRLVDDKIQAVQDEQFWRDMALTVLAVGLALLAAIPTGGSSLAVGAAALAGIGSFTVSAVMAAEHLDQFRLEKAMAGTDFDRARAIGAADPSLFWLAVDILGALMDLGPAIKGARAMLDLGRGAFRSVSGSARLLLTAGPDAAEALVKLREAAKDLHLPTLADRVLASIKKLGKPGGSIEKSLAKAAGHEADAVLKAAKELEEAASHALAQSPTRLGGHTISVTPKGWLVRCSHCGVLRHEFAEELGRDSKLLARLDAAEAKAVAAAEALAKGDKAGAEKLAKEAADEARAIADRAEAVRRIGEIRAYRGIDLSEIDDIFLMDERLVVDMPFVGKQVSKNKRNAAGWGHDPSYYWSEIYRRHPEAFSKANEDLIAAGRSPLNDEKFRSVFKQYDVQSLHNTKLPPHHIGQGGQCAAVPAPLHPGFGGIHNVEKAAGIWKFEDEIAEMLQRYLDMKP
jgi:hypothetical protein